MNNSNMYKFMFKLCAYALLGIVAAFVIWKFSFYFMIGLVVFGLLYFGYRRLRKKYIEYGTYTKGFFRKTKKTKE